VTLRDHLFDALRTDPVTAPLWNAGFRVRIGASACLAGEKVRPDGSDCRSNAVSVVLPLVAEVVSLCPEVAIGLGVPRPAMQRVRLAAGHEAVRSVEAHATDITARLDGFATDVVRSRIFHGYVFKARSASCAPGNAPLFDEHGVQIGLAGGRYAEHLRRAFPRAPMCDEEALVTMGSLARFVMACYRYAASLPAEGIEPPTH